MSRTLLVENLSYEDRISLAQLTTAPGWKILVKLMAEACRKATEEVIKLDPTVDRYPEKVAALQTTARAMNKFSGDVLDSIKIHQRSAIDEARQRDESNIEMEKSHTRFTGFRMPEVKKESPVEGAK